MTTDERLLILLAVDGPTKQPELAQRLGVPVREVQEAIQRLRVGGEPICSGDAGVWLARDADELAASNRRLHRRLVSQYASLRAQRHAERRMRAAERRDLTLWSA